jgi:hypothetical protein
MMDCKQYRVALLADPAAVTADMRAHGDTCPECAQFTQRVEAFEARLARAVRLPLRAAPQAPLETRVLHSPTAASEIPPARPAGASRPAVGRAPRWYAIAASLIAAVGAAGLLWLAVPRASLAGDVVTHMAEEPDAWRATTAAVSPAVLEAVTQDAHMRLSAATAGLVSYASSCAFRGHQVPHLVVQDRTGPVTVMVLVHESPPVADNFDEQGYRGEILPVPGHGAIAVLTRNQNLDAAALDRIALQLREAIRWTN